MNDCNDSQSLKNILSSSEKNGVNEGINHEAYLLTRPV